MAGEMGGAMARHHGDVPKVGKSSAQVKKDCMLGMTGDLVMSFDPTAAPPTF